MTAIVSDATTLIVLGKLGRVELLSAFFRLVVVPSEVMREIQAKEDSSYRFGEHPWLSVEIGTQLPLYRELSRVLDSGESEAMALAEKFGLPLLIDEKKGRTLAARRGIPVIGLVGLLGYGVKGGVLSPQEALDLLEKARSVGFRLSDQLARDFHRLVGG